MTNPQKLLSPMQPGKQLFTKTKQPKQSQTQIIKGKTPSQHSPRLAHLVLHAVRGYHPYPRKHSQILQQHGTPPPNKTSQNNSSKVRPLTSWSSPTTINHPKNITSFSISLFNYRAITPQTTLHELVDDDVFLTSLRCEWQSIPSFLVEME